MPALPPPLEAGRREADDPRRAACGGTPRQPARVERVAEGAEKTGETDVLEAHLGALGPPLERDQAPKVRCELVQILPED